MTRKEIDKKKQELVETLKKEDATERLKGLHRLAQEVGASITRIEKVETQRDACGHVYYKVSNEITETEIVHNIQMALQTETMLDMCKTQVETSGLQLPQRLSHYLQWWQLGRAHLGKMKTRAVIPAKAGIQA